MRIARLLRSIVVLAALAVPLASPVVSAPEGPPPAPAVQGGGTNGGSREVKPSQSDAGNQASANHAGGPNLKLPDAASVLGKLFVAAVIIESAFAVIFKSRLYQEFFNGRGLTTPLLIFFSYTIATAFHFDTLLGDFLLGFTDPNPADKARSEVGSWSKLLTALTLAGGSAGVNGMLQALGYRVPPPSPETHRPPEKKAWISVRVVNTGGWPVPAKIEIKKLATTPADAKGPLAGVTGNETVLARLRRLTIPDQYRYPRYGGHTVETDGAYEIKAIPLGKDLEENLIVTSFAERAIVDLTIVAKSVKPPKSVEPPSG